MSTDGTRHSFLVKGGEDLRTDARVMQLLRVMDDCLRSSLSHSHLRTYNVTPLTNRYSNQKLKYQEVQMKNLGEYCGC